MDTYPDLDPEAGEVLTADLFANEDVLVKAFALGPGAAVSPHEHGDSTNVFHVLSGTVTVLGDDTEARVAAPGVVPHERGAVHGARNDTEKVAVFTASLCPAP